MTTYRKYVDIDFKASTLELLGASNKILCQYEDAGYVMTLRQLYYQLVSRNVIVNSKTEYNRLGGIISDGRLAGLISWTAIEDRNRNLKGLRTAEDVPSALRETLDEYRIDKWQNQKFHPEVWVEKAALEGVIGGICNKLQVDFFACHGYNSQSEQWRAGRRFASYIQRGQTPIVFHLGDHDPSGFDMTRDNRDRLSMFAGVPIQVVRIALNMSQIEELKPPPNPAKMTDSRYDTYRKQFGDDCWELDALTPDYIHRLIEKSILQIRDQKAWDEMEAQETSDLRVLEMQIETMESLEGNDNG